MTDPKPAAYSGVMPYLIVPDPSAAIAFYERALGGAERMRLTAPDGAVMHAEVVVGGGVVMLAGEFPDQGYRGPRAWGGTPVSLMVYVDDCDATFHAAVDAGAEPLAEPAVQFYGDRTAKFADPAGHVWTVATHVEDVSPEEMTRRLAAYEPADDAE